MCISCLADEACEIKGHILQGITEGHGQKVSTDSVWCLQVTCAVEYILKISQITISQEHQLITVK